MYTCISIQSLAKVAPMTCEKAAFMGCPVLPVNTQGCSLFLLGLITSSFFYLGYYIFLLSL